MKKAGFLISALALIACGFSAPLSAQEAPKFLYGVASWYGDDFEGKPTASGEIFSTNQLTAAHKTLPFGTRLEVENLGNGKKVEVLVNDRGPFTENRIIDLSRRAAEILDFVNEGKTFVKVTILEMGDPVSKPINRTPPVVGGQDIPQGFNPTPAPAAPEPMPQQNAAAAETPMTPAPAPNVDETDFMNDTPPAANVDAPLRTQEITDTNLFGGNSAPPVGITNFSSNFIAPPTAADPLNPQNDPDLTTYSNIAYPGGISNVEPENTYEPLDPFADLADPFNTTPVTPENNIWYNNITPNAGQINSSNISQNIGANQPVPPQPIEIMPAAPMPPAPMQPAARPITPMPAAPAPMGGPQNNGVINNVIQTNTVESSVIPQNPGVIGAGPVSWQSNPPSPENAKSYFVVQIGAFSNSANAMKVYNILKNQADRALANVYTADVKTPIKGKPQSVMRVRIGFFLSQDEALAKAEEVDALLSKHGIKSSVIKVDYK